MGRKRKIQPRIHRPVRPGTVWEEFAYISPDKFVQALSDIQSSDPATQSDAAAILEVAPYELSGKHVDSAGRAILDRAPSREPRVNYGDYASKSPSSTPSKAQRQRDSRMFAPNVAYVNVHRPTIPGADHSLPAIAHRHTSQCGCVRRDYLARNPIAPSPHQAMSALRKLERLLVNG